MHRFYRAIAPRRNPLRLSFHTVCLNSASSLCGFAPLRAGVTTRATRARRGSRQSCRDALGAITTSARRTAPNTRHTRLRSRSNWFFVSRGPAPFGWAKMIPHTRRPTHPPRTKKAFSRRTRRLANVRRGHLHISDPPAPNGGIPPAAWFQEILRPLRNRERQGQAELRARYPRPASVCDSGTSCSAARVAV
jgi:hypothetical protein